MTTQATEHFTFEVKGGTVEGLGEALEAAYQRGKSEGLVEGKLAAKIVAAANENGHKPAATDASDFQSAVQARVDAILNARS